MFDIGFSELLLVGIVALVVIGPERLPKVARTAGHLFGRMQRYVSDVKADISREMQLEELKKMQEEMHASVNSMEQSVAKELSEGGQEFKSVAEQIHEIIEIPKTPPVADPQAVAGAAVSQESLPQLELDLGRAEKAASGHENAVVKENTNA